MKKFYIKPLVAAIALTAAGQGYAQEASAENTLEEVVVTGFRASLKTALASKKESVGAVDSIIAEDIGDFPDNNLADAMARIPGVNITRQGGEGSQVNVRGLSADFTRVRLNGMETISTSYGNTSRAFDFNTFASELFSRIDVKKTQTASLEEGSLGATVELYTARPLSASENSFMLGGSLGYNDESGEVDPRITGLASVQNSEGTIGGSVSVAYSQRNLSDSGHNTGRWEANSNSGNNQWANAADLSDEVNNAFHPRFPRALDNENKYDRLGLTGTLQLKPTEATLVTLDVLHSNFTYQVATNTLTPISLARTGSGGRLETTVGAYEYDSATNALVYAELSGVDVRAERAFIDSESTFNQFSLTVDHDITDSLRVHALLGTSSSETTVSEESTAILEAFNQDVTYDYRNDRLNGEVTFGSSANPFDPTDASAYQISEIRNRPTDTENTFQTGQLDLAWDLNDVFTLSAGVSVKEFTFDTLNKRQDRSLLEQNGPNQGESLASNLPEGCDIELSDLDATSSLGAVYTTSSGTDYLLPDFNAVGAQVGFSESSPCFPSIVRDDRTVVETDTGYYGQLDFVTSVADMELRGNAGVRTVTTDLESTGVIDGDNVTVKNSYSDTLPSLNAALSVTEDVTLRASWSKVMTRPSLGNLNPGGSLDGFNRTYSAGNPMLSPFRATATDLSVDWYFMEEALVSLAYFKKDIESFPASDTQTVPYRSLGLADSLLDQLPAQPTEEFQYRSVFDGGEGTLDGFEIQFQTPITFGPEWMQDFGVKANYTDISSKVNYSLPGDEPNYGPLNGQSDNSYNGTLWYENDSGFSGRVSYTYRSEYSTRLTSRLGADYGSDIVDAAAVVDAKFGYEISDNLTISLDLLNLTDEPETALLGSNGANLLDTTTRTGRQVYLGAQYKF